MEKLIPESNINSFFDILNNLELDSTQSSMGNEIFIYATSGENSLINIYLVSGSAYLLKNIEYDTEYSLLTKLQLNGIKQLYVVPNLNKEEFIKILTVLVEKLNISNAIDFVDLNSPLINLESTKHSASLINFSYQSSLLLAAENERQRRYRVKNALIKPLNSYQSKETLTYHDVYKQLYGNLNSIRILKGVNDN